MEKMTLNINTPNYELTYISPASTVEVKIESDTSKILSDPKRLQTDEVVISKEGKEKQLNEAATEALRKIMGKDEVDESAKSNKDSLDEMIAELQEKIAELTNKIARLKSSDDEDSLEEAKILEVKLVGLNAQLIELISRKLESTKSSA